MAVNVKMGVDMSGFKSGIADANAQLKTFDAQLKLADATMKSAGNSEQGLVTKTNALTGKLQTQKQLIQQYEKALENMKNAGVDPLSKDYQKLATALLNTKAGMVETEAALNNLNGSEQTAISTTNQLTDSMNSIGKKVSLEQVRSGIDKITGALENAAKKALQLGENIWNDVMDSARLSDDILTQATVLDMTPEMYQKYKGVFDTIGEITVTEWAAARRKIERAMTGPSSEQFDIFRALGFTQTIGGKAENQEVLRIADNWEDVFWQVGTEIQQRVSSGKLSVEMADVYGEAIFGKKYSSLKNLLKGGKEAFLEALEVQNTISDEALEKNAKLKDTVIKLSESFDALKAEVTAGIAPALTEAAGAIDSLLGSVLEYLKSENGKAMMDSLGESLKELFEGLKNVNPQEVAQKLVDVLNSIVGGMKWLIEHKEDVFHALEWIVGGWATLKLTGGALDVLKVINGAKGLTVGSGDGTGTGTETGTGTGSGGGFWSNLLNKATLFAAANAMYEATEGNIRENVEIFNKATEGMTDQQRNREALKVGFGMTDEEIDTYIDNVNQKLSGGHDILLPTELEPEENAAQKLAEEVGTVTLPASLDWRPSYQQGYEQQAPGFGGHANGIWAVPYDGYLARLHKNERVVPAREVAASRNFSSNLYVESMYMNNGADAEGLASAMAAAQRRTMSGYGS